jgi:hypothetical protein
MITPPLFLRDVRMGGDFYCLKQRRFKMKKVFELLIVLFLLPLTTSAQDFCEGNFDCDFDVDGADAAVFKEDFGRNLFDNPCELMSCLPITALPKTGQTTSYATGDDGDLEIGISSPNPRFTDNGDGTVRDNLTSLIWLKNAHCFSDWSWNRALSDCNELQEGMCELTDGSYEGSWRLPNYRELFSLVDAENRDPVLPSGHPFLYVMTSEYWTSTTVANWSNGAWVVSMNTGYVWTEIKSAFRYIWCVKDAQ